MYINKVIYEKSVHVNAQRESSVLLNLIKKHMRKVSKISEKFWK